MFLLLLMGLGAAAQVRIGGNAAPNAAAILDLNTDDTNTGTKGLALPRVSLTNVSTPLTGTPVVNGMMVYNTNASTTGGSGVGIYYWDGTIWVRAQNYVSNPPNAVIWTLVLDTTFTYTNKPGVTSITSPNTLSHDLCVPAAYSLYFESGNGYINIHNYFGSSWFGNIRLTCFRATLL